MANIPSLLMLRPNEPITPVPTQERVLDFTPIMQALATAPRTSSTSSSGSSKDDDEDYRDMRIGYAKQLFGQYRALQSQQQSLERMLGADVAYLTPEYQQLEAAKDRTASYENMMYGNLELDRMKSFDKELEEKGASQNYVLSEWRKGSGLRTAGEWSAYLHHVPSATFDPNNPDAINFEQFDFAPKFYNIEDARKEVDALFAPSMDKMNKTSWGDVVADIVGSAAGVSHKTGEKGNNYAALSDATKQALEYAGLRLKDSGKKDKNGDPIMQYEGVNLDFTSPIVSGYMQSFLQEHRQGDKQGTLVDSEGEVIASDEGLTSKGAEKFYKYVKNDIEQYHQGKRRQSFVGNDETFQEFTNDRAYTNGAGAQQFNDYIESATLFATQPYNVTDSGYKFDDLFNSTMALAIAKNGNMTPKQYKEFMATDAGKNLMREYKTLFDGTMTAQRELPDGTMSVPMYTVTRGGDGSEYYKPNPDFFGSNYNKNVEAIRRELISKVQLEQELIDSGEDVQGATRRLEQNNRNLALFNVLSNKAANDTVTANTNVSQYTTERVGSMATIEGQWLPDFVKSVTQGMAGTTTDKLRGSVYQLGQGSWVNASGMKDVRIMDDGSSGNIHMMRGPGYQYYGHVRQSDLTDKRLAAQGVTGIVAKGGFYYYADGRPFESSIDPNGNLENQSWDAGESTGYMLPYMDSKQYESRNAQAYALSRDGNPQAHYATPVATTVVQTLGFNSPDSFAGVKIAVESPYKFTDEDAQRAAAQAGNILTTTTSEDKNAIASESIGTRQGARTVYYSIDDSKLPKGVSIGGINKKLDKMGIPRGQATPEVIRYVIGSEILLSQGKGGTTDKVMIHVPIVNKTTGNTIEDVNGVFRNSHMLSEYTPEQQKTNGGIRYSIKAHAMVNASVGRVIQQGSINNEAQNYYWNVSRSIGKPTDNNSNKVEDNIPLSNRFNPR